MNGRSGSDGNEDRTTGRVITGTPPNPRSGEEEENSEG